ncbi:MAG: AmmeMemoRadiSam system radical SAM enzyme [archaeon]|jgi:pyruvate formate lyase activating enzyme
MQSKFYKKEGTHSIKCLACKHYCTISTNGFGLCGARKNVSNKLELITYSKPCSLALDPIEKKPLYHFLPGSETMSIGFFGCNFKCDFCQNFDISFTRGTAAEKALIGAEEVTPQKLIELALKRKAKSIAITYNEPAISAEYNLESFKLAHENKLSTIYVSNGYISGEQIKSLIKKETKLDAINVDLKSFNSEFYRKTCGGELESVLDCIKLIHKKGIHIELTTLVIPGKNDSPLELKQIADFIASIDKNIPWHVSAFFPMHKMTNISPTSTSEIASTVKIGKENGLNFVYGGNLHTSEFSNTFCPNCNNLLIKREGYNCEIVGLGEKEKNKCNKCGAKIEGVF